MNKSSESSSGSFLTRRRALTIMAAAGGLTLALRGRRAYGGREPAPVHWRGVALGARAEMILYHPDPARGRDILEQAALEVRRLEKVFSLYKGDSALSRLNGAGRLDTPPLDMVRLLSMARQFGDICAGAFDVTVQPLWMLYAQAARNGKGMPDAVDLRETLSRVDYRRVKIDTRRIAFAMPSMAITLNGIAQGYITDRVTDLLRREGITDVLVDLGEVRALGGHPNGKDWMVGVQNPVHAQETTLSLPLRNRALATSGGYGFSFDGDGAMTHIFDPRSGHSAKRYESVSVLAPHAVTADALSTAFCCMDITRIKAVVGAMEGVEAILLNGPEGRGITRIGGA